MNCDVTAANIGHSLETSTCARSDESSEWKDRSSTVAFAIEARFLGCFAARDVCGRKDGSSGVLFAIKVRFSVCPAVRDVREPESFVYSGHQAGCYVDINVGMLEVSGMSSKLRSASRPSTKALLAFERLLLAAASVPVKRPTC